MSNYQDFSEREILKYIKEGNIEIIYSWLEHGGDPNIKDRLRMTPFISSPNGYSALIIASQEGHIEIVKLLLKYGANTNYQTDRGTTATIVATVNNDYDIVKLLLENGANPNNQPNEGYNPLQIASIKGYNNIIRLLLDNGIDPNKDYIRGTPLSLAIMEGNIETVKLLLEKGADPTLIDDFMTDFMTPYELALEEGYTEIARLIQEYMDLQRARQNLAFASSMIPQSNDTPLRHLDYHTLGEIMSRSRPYDPSIQIRMLEENRNDNLTKSKQRLATMKGIHDSDSVLQYLREPQLMENIDKHLSSIRPNIDVHSRMMLEDKQKTKKKSVSSEEIVVGSKVEFMIKGIIIVGIVEKETPKKYKICCKPGKVSGEKGSIYMVDKSDVQLVKKGGKLSSKKRSGKKKSKTKKKN